MIELQFNCLHETGLYISFCSAKPKKPAVHGSREIFRAISSGTLDDLKKYHKNVTTLNLIMTADTGDRERSPLSHTLREKPKDWLDKKQYLI